MPLFRPGDPVAVVALHGSAQGHLSEGFAVRPPELGDVGVVVKLVPAGVVPAAPRYVVEGGERGAAWAWLAEFAEAELQRTTLPL